jgi:hypothetical protein
MDHETFDVLGRWEVDRGPQELAYDLWWHLGHDTMVTSEWGTPDMFENGLVPELLRLPPGWSDKISPLKTGAGAGGFFLIGRYAPPINPWKHPYSPRSGVPVSKGRWRRRQRRCPQRRKRSR